MKQNMTYNHIPLDQEWKLSILHELLKVKEDNFVINNFVYSIEIATINNFYVPTRNYIYIYIYFILVFVYRIVPFYLSVNL